MANDSMRDPEESLRGSHRAIALAGAILMAALMWLGSADEVAAATFCSDTAGSVYRACGFDVQDDYWLAVAVCINEPDRVDRQQCNADALASRSEGNELCKEQLLGRLGACKSLGEERYDPEFEPQLFDHDFTRLSNPNPYFPLRIGNRWEYQSETETVNLEVLNETKLIDEVRCIVVRDLVLEEGQLHEATDDWYAQAKDGNVWYCGEEVRNFENFAGDEPQRPELVNTDGSFKAGREGDKPGIIFLARPMVGQTYQEEFSLNNAEDITEIFSTTYSYGIDQELDRFVPRRLARLLCNGDCVVSENFSLLEPGVSERKYYARGIGLFLEVNADTGEIHQLVDCNFDRRCQSLPRP